MHSGVNTGHTYFIIDKEGIIRFAFDDPYMGTRNDELLKEIERLDR
jgi:peroxiredoxin